MAANLETGGFDRQLRQMRLRLQDNASKAMQCTSRYFPKGSKVPRPPRRLFFMGGATT